MAFTKATKHKSKLRLALIGPSGSGKTYSALAIASALGKKIAVIDTERGSASLYSDKFNFDVDELDNYDPRKYIASIEDAGAAGYDVLIIDSLTHAWSGKGGALELVDEAATKSQSKNSFAAWREVTPLHNDLVNAILGSHCHVIVTMRAKTEYVMDKDEKTGKSTPRKVGMAPIQRDGLEYEFTVVGDMDLQNNLIISKTRCSTLTGKLFKKPGKDVADMLLTWLDDGAAIPTCAVCDGIIESTTMGGKNYSAEELAAMSEKKWGKRMCKACIKAEAENGRAAE
jgi:DNA polymerase III delta prime subunit